MARIEKAYQLAREQYVEYGVDTEGVLKRLAAIRISLHCWQGDDVAGFEPPRGNMGGLVATGNYPGKARTPEELRADMAKALELIPGRHRVNLHALYAETGGKRIDRDALAPEHFAGWAAWARAHRLGLDFNGSFFSHPLAESGRTLSHQDRTIRQFWVNHGRACRRIGAYLGRQLKTPCVTNVWIPDGYKDTPADRKAPRELLCQSLDEIFKPAFNPAYNLDALEGKLFGIGSESYVVGSYDFYLAYAVAHRKLLCLDMGHFHPTELVADKLSAVLVQLPRVLLHVSRGVRWDSDHVVTLTDELRLLAGEIVRGDYLRRVHIGLDYFDASINRVAAWVIGARAMLQALLIALLEPQGTLRRMELEGDFTARLALMEEIKSLPFGVVWDYYCCRQNVPPSRDWMRDVKTYETAVQSKRC